MGAMGRRLAKASVAQLDRVIMATRWGFGQRRVQATYWANNDPDGLVFGCLLEHIYGNADKAAASKDFWSVGIRGFDFAVTRFGLPRVVRAIKLRAARLNGSDASTIRDILGAESSTDAVVGGGR